VLSGSEAHQSRKKRRPLEIVKELSVGRVERQRYPSIKLNGRKFNLIGNFEYVA
jgi:hypothetical protein